MSKQDLLKEEIGRFDDIRLTCHYFSDGRWSLHDLLAYLLEQSGKSVIKISSYSVSEASVREFLRLKEKGLISSLHCLLDYTVKPHKGGILYFANNVADEIRMAANHSKIILIDGEFCKFTVLTSANFTVNPRYESGMITNKENVYDFYLKKFSEAFDKAIPVIYE